MRSSLLRRASNTDRFFVNKGTTGVSFEVSTGKSSKEGRFFEVSSFKRRWTFRRRRWRRSQTCRSSSSSSSTRLLSSASSSSSSKSLKINPDQNWLTKINHRERRRFASLWIGNWGFRATGEFHENRHKLLWLEVVVVLRLAIGSTDDLPTSDLSFYSQTDA